VNLAVVPVTGTVARIVVPSLNWIEPVGSPNVEDTDDANVAVRVTGTPTNVLPLLGVNVTLVAALVICMVTTLDFDPRKFTLSPE
jgi:hypothetical protein